MNKQSFADLGVSPVVARTLAGRGLERPFPVQASVIPDVLGRSTASSSALTCQLRYPHRLTTLTTTKLYFLV